MENVAINVKVVFRIACATVAISVIVIFFLLRRFWNHYKLSGCFNVLCLSDSLNGSISSEWESVCVSADVNMCSGQDVLQFDATYTNANVLVHLYI